MKINLMHNQPMNIKIARSIASLSVLGIIGSSDFSGV